MSYLGREAAKAPLVTADLPDDSITSAKIVDATIAAGDLAANSVDSSELVDGSIDTSHIADNQVTLAKMAGGTDGQIITYDASGDPLAVGPGTDGQVLTSTGAGSPPAFEDAAGAALECVAHIAFDQTDHSIKHSQNISGVTQIVSGETTINFDTDMPDTNYAVCGLTGQTSVGAGVRWMNLGNEYQGSAPSFSTSSFRCQCLFGNHSNDWSLAESDNIHLAIFR